MRIIEETTSCSDSEKPTTSDTYLSTDEKPSLSALPEIRKIRDFDGFVKSSRDLTPTRLEFNQTVIDLKKKLGFKLHEIFNVRDAILSGIRLSRITKDNKLSLMPNFLGHPIISRYLSRPFDQVEWLSSDGIPLSGIKNTQDEVRDKKLNSDFYEMRMYHLMNLFNNRNAAISKKDYLQQGLSYFDAKRQMFSLKKRIDGKSIDIFIPEHAPCEMTGYPSLEKYRDLLNVMVARRAKNESSETKFIIGSVGINMSELKDPKENHMISFLHVLSEKTKKIRATVLINSWDDRDYSLDIEKSFNKNKDIIFIDASHSLQLEEDDKNCVLYSANFLRAVVTMLTDTNNPGVMQDVLTAAENAESAESQAQLVDVFRGKLKKYLPFYYRHGAALPSQDIHNYHLSSKWKIGKEFLLMNYWEDIQKHLDKQF